MDWDSIDTGGTVETSESSIPCRTELGLPREGCRPSAALPVDRNCIEGDITSRWEVPGHAGVGRVEEELSAEGRRTW